MFIPNYSKEIKEGYKVILRTDYCVKGGIFTRGHMFTVKTKSKNGSELIDDNGNTINVSPSKVILVTTLKEAKQLELDTENFHKKLNLIEEHCQQRDYDFDEYDKFFYCKLKGRNSHCNPKLECEQYCDKVKLRKLKIKEITK